MLCAKTYLLHRSLLIVFHMLGILLVSKNTLMNQTDKTLYIYGANI